MPVGQYFKGRGKDVMRDMKNRYGERAESVFYATAKKKQMLPQADSDLKKSMKAVMRGRQKAR